MAISLDDLNKDGLTAEELAGQSPDAQPQEQQTEPTNEEPADEPTVDEPVEQPKAEEPAEAPTEGQPQDQPPTEQFDYKTFLTQFNEQTGKTYESLDQVKADLEKPTMESEYGETKEQLDSLQAKYNELNETYELLMEQSDPSTYFSSDEAMKLEIFKKQNPKKDASIAQKIFSEDLSKVEDIDMVKMGWKFNSTKSLGTDAEIEAAVKSELGVDPDDPDAEWTSAARIRLARMADEYRGHFDQIRQGVEVPTRVNIEELKAQRQQERESRLASLQEGWDGVSQEVAKTADSVKLPIGEPKEGEEQQFFEWKLDAVPEEDIKTMKDHYIQMGINPDDEGRDMLKKAVEVMQVEKNLPKILQKYGEDLLARQKEEHLDETNNTNPLKDHERPELGAAEKELKERSAFALEGLGNSLTGHPLFKKTHV